MLRYQFHPDASLEYGEAVDYYIEINPLLADAFVAEVEYSILMIRKYPNWWRLVAGNFFARPRLCTENYQLRACSSISEHTLYSDANLFLRRNRQKTMDPQDCEWYLDNRDLVAQCHQQGLQKVDRE